MTETERMIVATEKNLIVKLQEAIKLAEDLNRFSRECDWTNIDCSFDDRDLGEMLKKIYNGLSTGNRNDDTYQDELFKN